MKEKKEYQKPEVEVISFVMESITDGIGDGDGGSESNTFTDDDFTS